MKLKRSDIELLMQYIEKEKPETVEIAIDNYHTSFEFRDAEARTCIVKLFDTMTSTTPELTKTMKLYSRVKK